jgi:tetratricopeptide (TPR) repeat protein
MPTKAAFLFTAMLLAHAAVAADSVKHDDTLEAGRQAYEASDYAKAAQLLHQAALNNPQSAEIHWWLAKTYYESQQHDAAISSAERAVALDPQNSRYHEWLGKAYGEKADHAVMFSALSLAKKARKEFAKAVELDEKNFSAYQALIEFDCSAPGIAGGGEDKARAEIEKVAALDAAEGHYATGNCRRQKKDFATADSEFDKALAAHPKSADLIYDIGDFAMKRGQPERLIAVANEGEKTAPADPRGKFYRAVALILKREHLEDAEELLRDYLKLAPTRDNFPHPWRAHEWLGRLYENQHKTQLAIDEYEIATKLEPKNKFAREAVRKLKKG